MDDIRNMDVPTPENPHIVGRIDRAGEELQKGLRLICEHPKSVTMFGSTRFTENNPHYKKAQSIAKKLADAGYNIITGGGPGIMEAANRGAAENTDPENHSIGFAIELPLEQTKNKYVEESVDFHYFFTRKVSLTFAAEAYIYFPGGFGTLDEFFEILTLVQTKKIPNVPMILVGDEYWGSLDAHIKKVLLEEYQTISPEDRNLYTITEDEDKIVDIVTSAPLRNKVC